MDNRARSYVVSIAWPGLSWDWMVCLDRGPWTGSRGYCAQSKQMHRARLTPDPVILGPCVLDRGPLVLGL